MLTLFFFYLCKKANLDGMGNLFVIQIVSKYCFLNFQIEIGIVNHPNLFCVWLLCWLQTWPLISEIWLYVLLCHTMSGDWY